MKTFVVTGCNGYIGSHMCYELRQRYPDCTIVGVDKVDKPHLRHLYDDFIHADLRELKPGHIECPFKNIGATGFIPTV